MKKLLLTIALGCSTTLALAEVYQCPTSAKCTGETLSSCTFVGGSPAFTHMANHVFPGQYYFSHGEYYEGSMERDEVAECDLNVDRKKPQSNSLRLVIKDAHVVSYGPNWYPQTKNNKLCTSTNPAQCLFAGPHVDENK